MHMGQTHTIKECNTFTPPKTGVIFVMDTWSLFVLALTRAFVLFVHLLRPPSIQVLWFVSVSFCDAEPHLSLACEAK